MSYEFTDTTQRAVDWLPSEAMSINGHYIESIIPGYRTLNVAGRELMSTDVTTEEVGRRNGTIYRSKKYPERVITVTYQLMAETNEEFRRYFEKLNNVLNVEQAKLIFADDVDHYFIGTPSEAEDIEPGTNSVIGNFSIICADPFKYSVEEFIATPGSDGVFKIDYHGNFPSYPKVMADFYKSTSEDANAKCGYIAFFNERANILQFGKPELTDELLAEAKSIKVKQGSTITSERLITSACTNITDWTLNSGTVIDEDLYLKTGSLQANPFGTESDTALRPNSYGSGASIWHGPTASRSIPSDSQGVATHTNWSFAFSLRFAATAQNQIGTFQAFVTDGTDYIAGVEVIKQSAGNTKGTIRAYVNGSGCVREWNNIDLSSYGAFGSRSKAHGITIEKSGSTFKFTVGNLTYSYNKATTQKASAVSFYFGSYGSSDPVAELGIYSCKFASDSVTKTWTSGTVADIQSWLKKSTVFGTNDILIADCSNATVYVKSSYDMSNDDGAIRQDLGALGNDWERFFLSPGMNKIGTTYSDWMPSGYGPTFRIAYREVFL